MTFKRKIILKPLEEVQFQIKGTIDAEKFTFDESLDQNFKPGLFNQLQAFLNFEKTNLISLKMHIENSKYIYKKMIS